MRFSLTSRHIAGSTTGSMPRFQVTLTGGTSLLSHCQVTLGQRTFQALELLFRSDLLAAVTPRPAAWHCDIEHEAPSLRWNSQQTDMSTLTCYQVQP